MTALPAHIPSDQDASYRLARAARFPRLRALAWAGDQLYAGRGYQLLVAKIRNPPGSVASGVRLTTRPEETRITSG